MLEAFEPDIPDIEELAARLRKYDRLEAAAFSETGRAYPSIEYSVTHSEGCLGVREHESGEIVCIFGVAKEDVCGAHAVPWFLGTDLVRKYPREMIVWARQFIQAMVEEYELLENVVHADNLTSIAWLQHLGFYVNQSHLIWIREEPFYKFCMPGFDKPRSQDPVQATKETV